MKLIEIAKVGGPARRGSVLIIATLFLMSATLRLITGASDALAQDSQLPTSVASSANADGTSNTEDKTIAAQPEPRGISNSREELSSLLQALQQRELRITEREKQLEMRLRALAIADAEIEKRLVALTETEQALRDTLSLADDASEKDLLKLTSVYESMKAKDAALLFEQMEPHFSAGFLGRMRPDVAAEIMAGLSPQVAYSVSVILAGRNANAPKS